MVLRKKNGKRFYSMNTLLLGPILLLICLFLGLNTAIIYRLAIRQLRQSALENMSDTVSQATRLLEAGLLDVATTFYQIDHENRSTLNFCSIVPNPSTYYSNYIGEIGRSIQEAYFANYGALDSIALYLDRDDLLIYQGDLSPIRYSVNQSAWQEYENAGAQWRILQPHQYILETNRDKDLALSVFRVYKSRYNNISYLVQFNIKYAYIENLLQGIDRSADGGAILMDDSFAVAFDDTSDMLLQQTDLVGRLLAAGDDSGYYSVEAGGKSYLVIYDTLSLSGWRIASFVSEESLERRATTITSASVIMLTLLLLLAALVVLLVVRSVVRPLTRIVRRIEEIGENDLDIAFEDDSVIREVHYLTKTLNFLIIHSQSLLERVKIQQELKRRAEFTAMQAQIKPHFLYNSLYAIKQLCARDGERAERMIMALSEFYRIGVNNPNCELSLEHEFKIAESYLELNRMRYGKLISYRLTLDPSLSRFSILKMTLQPIIENCFKHGFDDEESHLVISVEAERRDTLLCVSVRDNGCGMPPRQLDRIRAQIERPVQSVPDDVFREDLSGTGIRNVHQRLRMFYGEEYGLVLDSVEGEGTVVMVLVPLIHFG